MKRQIRTLVCTVRLLKPMDNIGYFPRTDWHLIWGKINISEQCCQIRHIYGMFTPGSSHWLLWNWMFEKTNTRLLAFVSTFVYLNLISDIYKMVDVVLASTILWNVKKNKWKWKIIQNKEGRDQSKKSLPITDLCRKLGFVPGTLIRPFLPFQTL